MVRMINTIQDMLHFYYNPEFREFRDSAIRGWLQKADDPLLTTTTGAFNSIQSMLAFSQLNQEANAVGIMPKTPYKRTGTRAITTRSGTSGGGGVAENATTLPDSEKPDLATFDVKPKIIVKKFESSILQELSSQVDDTLDIGWLRNYMKTEHMEDMNIHLLTDLDTLAGNNLESIDRVVASNSEIAGGHGGAGDGDIYGIDRDAGASWADSYVNHNSQVNRAISDALIRDVDSGVRTNGGNPQVWLTGYDTQNDIAGLYSAQQRFVWTPDVRVQLSVGGIKTLDGTDVGLRVSSLYGKPLIADHNTPASASGASNLYLLDTTVHEGGDYPAISFMTALPTQMYEAGWGSQSNTFLEMDRPATVGAYLTVSELRATAFKYHGKLIDLS